MAGNVLRVVGGIGLLAALAGQAFAGGIAVREQSAEGQGASFAGVAAGTNGLSSIFWNPATLSQHGDKGLMSETDVSLLLPAIEASGAGPLDDSGNIAALAIIPSSYYVYGVNDQLTIGAYFGAPLGSKTNAENGWMGAIHGDKSLVKTYNLSPSAAYKMNDWLTVALGAQIEYMAVDLTSRLPGSGAKVLDVEAADLGFGFTAGVLFEPTESTDIGIGFRSAVAHELAGDGFVGKYVGDVTAGFTSPEIVTIGIRQDVTDQLTFLGGVEWSNWSRFKTLDVVADPLGVTLGSTPEHWKDSWYVSLGAEYAYNDKLMLRAGAAFEKSPVPDQMRNPRVPDNDRLWLSLGASYKISDSFTAHAAYSHVFIDDGTIDLNAGGGLPALAADFKQQVDIVSISVTRDW